MDIDGKMETGVANGAETVVNKTLNSDLVSLSWAWNGGRVEMRKIIDEASEVLIDDMTVQRNALQAHDGRHDLPPTNTHPPESVMCVEKWEELNQ